MVMTIGSFTDGDSYRPPPITGPVELTALFYNRHYFGPGFEQDIDLLQEFGLPVCLRFTTDRAALTSADAVLFHLPTLEHLPEQKAPGQKWVLVCMESEVNIPLLSRKAWTDEFDLLMTYRRDSDVPMLYFNTHQYPGLTGETSRPAMAVPAPVLYLASNPVRWRDDYVGELSRWIAVDSYGRCLRNRFFEDVESRLDPAEPEQSLIASYPFYLAFENTCAVDYVTEKLVRPLAVGTVPVYMGAPNVEAFLPDSSVVIHLDRFQSPRQLAGHLQGLVRRRDAYRALVDWRTKPWPEHFRRLLAIGDTDPRARLAIKLAHRCNRACFCGGRLV